MNKGLIIIIVLLAFTIKTYSQKSDLPNIILKTLNNKSINISDFSNEPLLILSFWATWCSNCIYELDEISDIYPNWQKETHVKMLAISIDDNRTIARVKPFIQSHQWPFKILLDKNQKLKRTYNISDIPYTIILKKGKIIYTYSGYTPGNEDDIFNILKNNLK